METSHMSASAQCQQVDTEAGTHCNFLPCTSAGADGIFIQVSHRNLNTCKAFIAVFWIDLTSKSLETSAVICSHLIKKEIKIPKTRVICIPSAHTLHSLYAVRPVQISQLSQYHSFFIWVLEGRFLVDTDTYSIKSLQIWWNIWNKIN